jgi:tRNA(fMet)-specific endonuclease VapC
MAVLIDASILIEHERRRFDIVTYTRNREEEEFHISVITASELLHGAHRAREPSIRARRAAYVDAVLDQFPVVPIDLEVARTHARLWAELAAAGTPVGPHDLWLAATCVANGWILATANVREFRLVAGLEIEEWR